MSTDTDGFSSGPRAPPSFSAPTLTSTQRKRPALSSLGVESTITPELTTPKTPTPLNSAESVKSEIILKMKPTPLPASNPQRVSNDVPVSRPPASQRYDVREPQLVSILELLSDFQHHYAAKERRIETLEEQIRVTDGQLQQKHNELQLAVGERIDAGRMLEEHVQQLCEFEAKLREFAKYEGLISGRFTELESLMSEMAASKAQYHEQMGEMMKEVADKKRLLDECSRTARQLTEEREALKAQLQTAEEEYTRKLAHADAQMHTLDSEGRHKTTTIGELRQERDMLLADMRNMTSDRDKHQREAAQALKEITELAVSEPFSRLCTTKDLGSLERSVNWIRSICVLLHERSHVGQERVAKLREEMELLRQELELVRTKTREEADQCQLEQSARLEEKEKTFVAQLERLTAENKTLEARCQEREKELQRLRAESEQLTAFKRRLSETGLGGEDGWEDRVFDRFDRSEAENKAATLAEELASCQRQHQLTLETQKEEFVELLRKETAKGRAQREELEGEIARLRTERRPEGPVSPRRSRRIDPDLTAIIRDLRENADNLPIRGSAPASQPTNKRGSTPSNARASGSLGCAVKKRTRLGSNGAGSRSQATSPERSPSSVNSNDIWSIFK